VPSLGRLGSSIVNVARASTRGKWPGPTHDGPSHFRRLLMSPSQHKTQPGSRKPAHEAAATKPRPGSRPGQSRAGITVRPDLRRRPEGARRPERGPCPRSGRACDSGGAKGALRVGCWTRPARCSHRDLMCDPIGALNFLDPYCVCACWQSSTFGRR
jgi:hypothetical protein